MSQAPSKEEARLRLAERLKDEGNALFSKQKYGPASKKYTEAIAIDNSNPILYANRSACRLSLKQYLDAVADATRAVELNPMYAKAYARVATARDALGQPSLSKVAWQKALDALPSENLTEAEMKQKKQYEDGLAAALKATKEEETNDRQHVSRMKVPPKDATPWMCGMEMLPQLRREENYHSSAWLIAQAYHEFQRGTQMMMEIYTYGDNMVNLNLGALETISNAMLYDTRVFHVPSPSWLPKFNQQVVAESQIRNAWTTAGPDKVFQEAENRLLQEGWDNVRPALSTTVRCWILRALLEGGLRSNHVSEVEYLGRVIEVIEWGRKVWKDVDFSSRGAIFRDTFLRGVKKLHMEALTEAYHQEKDIDAKNRLLEDLFQEAESIIQDVDGNPIPPRENDPSFAEAYYYYPRGFAKAIKAFYYKEKSQSTKGQEESDGFMMKALQAYLDAVEDFPEDEEKRATFLNGALENAMRAGAPVKMQLQLMEDLRTALPRIQKIWAYSPSAISGRDNTIKKNLEYEAEIRRLLAAGTLTQEDRYRWSPSRTTQTRGRI
ncbi:TPR-likeprotein [Moniliophthora roreri]|uniref:Uncharacterized protein n=1 Tax=Moniliophthora roreri TaxID=221103 RepID=A0A0W0G4I8_MONRR|nr:TPR-likeprotein [Moniliophthora roreri]